MSVEQQTLLEIELDGQCLSVAPNQTIIEVADQAGVPIPRFCYHQALSIASNCRMCLVEVENSDKPLPACSTRVAAGMKIHTCSDFAVQAQQSVMEFLLINHPLDCPICDQGGECDLQDIAVAYGGVKSRYQEEKRVVVNKNIGPLISTDMTRCIQCTRCVRFLQEVGGIMELGVVGRGEHAEITAYVGKSVESELSGNIIDLCPVGALTSKPFRYSVRSWELSQHPSIAPHDGLGSHVVLQVKNNQVKRVLPRTEPDINSYWLSDRDRFSYQGLHAPDRLTQPMIRRGDHWQEVDWKTALEFAVGRLRSLMAHEGADALGVLVSPQSTLEEGYLARKLATALGCGNIDYRLRQRDFRLDGVQPEVAGLGCTLNDLDQLDKVLIIGSHLRQEHPLIAARFRVAAQQRGTRLSYIGFLGDDPLITGAERLTVAPQRIVATLRDILYALAQQPQVAARLSEMEQGSSQNFVLARELKGIRRERTLRASVSAIDLVQHLVVVPGDTTPRLGVFLGNMAQQHPYYAEIYSLAQAIAVLSSGHFGVLSAAANSAGLDYVGVRPSALNAYSMLESSRKAYLLVQVEPEFDCHNAVLAQAAMQQAECVVALSAYRSAALEHAHVILPVTPFSETSGSFMNMVGSMQSFQAAVMPTGEARPVWKVLRVLGNMFGFADFDYANREAVYEALLADCRDRHLQSVSRLPEPHLIDIVRQEEEAVVWRVADVPACQVDGIVRRAPVLQQRNPGTLHASMSSAQLLAFGLNAGDAVLVLCTGKEAVRMIAQCNEALPFGCVHIPVVPGAQALGDFYGPVTVMRALS